MDELLEQFLIEGRDLIAQASADFVLLSDDPGNAAAIDSAFRAIHTLKGSVGIFPMGPAERVLHAAEEVLEQARKAGVSLEPAAIAGLIACLDAVDRWVDELENAGALSADADAIASAALARLPLSAGTVGADDGPEPDWLARLFDREAPAIDAADSGLVAFRYTPDGDCFFRGEDPLAVANDVPELVALAILPVEGVWPDANAIEPFTCFSILEGLSTAPLEAVRATFRLMPDQVKLHRIDAAARPENVATSAGSRGGATLRIDAARVDALADGLGELVVATNAFASLSSRAEAINSGLATEIRAVQANIERVASNLHRSISAVRLVPLAPTLRRLPRMARDIAAGLGKQIDFVMFGDALEVDKQLSEGLFESLLHLVRNAIDHGIETPEDREAAGKTRVGRISLSAARDGDSISIVLEDDGGGIDPERIRTTAVSRGLISEDAASQLSDAMALRLIFSPGFSTAHKVTEVSGRGVGMDAVQHAVERMRGTVDIASEVGKGTQFRLRLPANALTTRLLVIEVGADRYGVALDQIVETVRLDSAALMPIGEGSACVLRGRTVPVLSLAALLGGTDTPTATAKLLVTRSGGERVALRVDGFAERLDTLVKPSSGVLARVPGVTGSTLLGDGSVLLVLDLPALAA